jgi:DNA helicase IV
LSRESEEIFREQQYVSMLYDRLDGLRERASGRLSRVLSDTGGTPAQRTQRDGMAIEYSDRLGQLDAAENGLCFGRLDLIDGPPRYVGRIGIRDEDSDYEPLLVDWRAPAARAFYVATAAAPLGVRRRRHIRTRQRTVTGLDDDALDLAAASGDGGEGADGATRGLVGGAALLAAVNANRTGRMRDVVETIQAEQDEAIRAELSGVLVVQGGPGTGKTAVALHRAAYLLYTHRDRLARRGVLIVGPNMTFLRYISHVLPGLGETGAVLCTLGELYPGVAARRAEPAEAAEIKGRALMVDVVAAAVRAHERVPDEAIEIVVDGVTYLLDPETVRQARDSARRLNKPHNLARPVFAAAVLDALVQQAVDRLNEDPFADLTREFMDEITREFGDPEEPVDESFVNSLDTADLRRELAADPAVRDTLNWLWPDLTPERLLTDLFASRGLLRECAPQLTRDERAAVHCEPGRGWAVSDVPLLDEAAELLGAVDTAAIAAQRLRRQRIEYAQGVLDVVDGSRSIDFEDPREEIVAVTDLVDAEMLAERQEETVYRTIADRAAVDRTWTFGHVVVDEAQELSSMAWRLLMRRCPSQSMTVVGDVAQTSDPAGTSSWGRTLAPYVGSRWRLATLTVNYRTPTEIMDLAATVLARIDPQLRPPRSVRASGVEPWRETAAADRLGKRLGELALRETERLGDGRLAVIVPMSRADELTAAVLASLPDASHGIDPDLERQTVVLTVRQAKGLEFDTVIVVDPDTVVSDAPRGNGDLYVALTRATQRLGVLAAAGAADTADAGAAADADGESAADSCADPG